MTDAKPLIQLDKLTKTYGHRDGLLTVLDEVELKLFGGDMVSIMGESGAGKSTLLQIIGTLDSPSSGQYLFNGEDVFARKSKQVAAFRNERIGFVFQFHHLLPEFTALENVMMPGLIGRMKRSEAERRAEELLTRVGLAERIGHQPGELSGGEQQRVAIARALFMGPRVLLADEPTANLDSVTGNTIIELMKELNATAETTFIFSTHDPKVMRQATRIIRLVDGKIVHDGSGTEGVIEATDPALANEEE